MSGSLLTLRWDGGTKLGGAHKRRFQVMAQFEPDIPYPLRHDLPGFLPPGRVATSTIGLLLLVFVSQRRPKSTAMQIQLDHIRGRECLRRQGDEEETAKQKKGKLRLEEKIVANPGSTRGEAIGLLIELEVNNLLRPIAEEHGCVYVTAGRPNPRTNQPTKLLLKDSAGHEYQIDAVIANPRMQPLVLIESKYIRYKKHNRDKSKNNIDGSTFNAVLAAARVSEDEMGISNKTATATYLLDVRIHLIQLSTQLFYNIHIPFFSHRSSFLFWRDIRPPGLYIRQST
jgi:hypothetical protein